MSRITRVVLGAAAAVFLTSFRFAHAVNYTWTGTGAGDWSNPANWSGGILPVSDRENALIFTGTGTAPFVANNDMASPFKMYVLNVNSTATDIQLTGGPIEF